MIQEIKIRVTVTFIRLNDLVTPIDAVGIGDYEAIFFLAEYFI